MKTKNKISNTTQMAIVMGIVFICWLVVLGLSIWLESVVVPK